MREIKERFRQLKTEKKFLKNNLSKKKEELAELKESVVDLEKARWIMTEVAKQTQQDFKEQIETPVTSALAAVYTDRDFKFVLEFVRKRNKLEAEMKIFEGEDEYSPEDDLGGGVLDIIAVMLRIVLWKIEEPRSINTIILDEPFRQVGSYTIRVGRVLREITQALNLQILLTTHNEELQEIADKRFKVTYKNKQTYVKEIVI